MPSHAKYFHHLIAQVVDHLDRDASGGGFGEWPRRVAVQSGPSVGVDLGFERGLEGSVRVLHAEEVGVAHEKTLLVVVRVDEPTGDAVRAVAANLAGVGMEDIHAIDLDLDLTVVCVENVDIRLPEDHEQIALARVLEIVGHVEIRVHARFEHRDAPQFVELRGLGVVVERAGDEHIEIGFARLAHGPHQVGTRDRAELGADENARAFVDARIRVALGVRALGANQIARPRRERRKRDPVVFARLLHARGFEMLHDHLGKILRFTVAAHCCAVDEVVVFIDAQNAVRG